MTMHVLERDSGEIVAARLAELLNVAPATVTMTLKRMERDNWIHGTGRSGLSLTDTGRAAAHSVVRRHMLTEWLLVSVFKMPINQTHEEAHNLEHAISSQLEERMRQALGDPQVCPHGNPMPGSESVTRAWLPLTELPAGTALTLRRIHEFAEDNPEILNFLYENGLTPGQAVTLREVLPFNQTLSLDVNGKTVTLGFSIARFVYAEK
ncbi:MAG: metal-dependent transcriptional regulator [Anaerolineales bacterium]